MTAYQKKITIALLIATFLSAIEGTIVSTATPAIVNKLGGIHLISWVFAIYLLTSAVTTPIFGKFADLFGRKKVFLIGTSIFLIGCMLCGLAQSMGQLIFFRAIQGIGAGAVIPVTFTIIGDIFTFEQRAKVQGLISSVWGIAGLMGPLLGGMLVDLVSWHWIFYINVPFGLVSMWMIYKHLEETIAPKKRKIDYFGVITFTIGTTTLLYVLLAGGASFAWNSSTTYMLSAVAILFLALFVKIELTHEEPIIPFKLFKNKEILTGNAVAFIVSLIIIGISTYIPLWVQNVIGKGATFSGFILMPMSIGWPLAATFGSRLMLKIGAKPIALTGVVLTMFGTFMLTIMTTATPLWMTALVILVLGFGFGCAITTFTIVVQSAVGVELRGVATSSNTFVRTLGQTIGAAIFGFMLNMQIGTSSASHVASSSLANAIHSIFIAMFIIAIVSFFVTLCVPKKQRIES